MAVLSKDGSMSKGAVKEQICLMDHLRMLFPDSSNSSIKKWIVFGRVLVNGSPETRGDCILNVGDTVSVGAKKKIIDDDLEILYEDQYLVVINKPAGLLSVAEDIEKEKSAHRILKLRTPEKRVFPVHRLDKDTSGVMLFAYGETSRRHFKELFFHHEVQREYLAILEGIGFPEKGTWKSYLQENAKGMVFQISNPKEGKLATTHFTKIKEGAQFTLVSFRLETGRKNQIRVQAASNGFAVAGDKKYGAKMPVKRLMLHAKLLGFTHPVSKKKHLFEIEPNREFDTLLRSSRF
jgi:23S rRNA pseudouridine1911/1915/1917 synthase